MSQIYSHEDLEALVIKLGFLPFFKNEIHGFSIEEHTPSELWFSGEDDGPWEWKGPVAGNGNCAYGKLFRGKAGFVSMDWFPDFVNYRRSVYPINVEIGNPSEQNKSKLIYDKIVERESLLSKELKALCGYKKQRNKHLDPVELWESEMSKSLKSKQKRKGEGFETIMTQLQMGTWIIIADFEYLYDKHQQPYGWGIARYTTPEALFGTDKIQIQDRSPEESKQKIFEHLSNLLPQATPPQIFKIIG